MFHISNINPQYFIFSYLFQLHKLEIKEEEKEIIIINDVEYNIINDDYDDEIIKVDENGDEIITVNKYDDYDYYDDEIIKVDENGDIIPDDYDDEIIKVDENGDILPDDYDDEIMTEGY
jgi:hypothetical protein